jgi:serine protease Do
MRFLSSVAAFIFSILLMSGASARPAPESFSGLAEKLLPTVVNIATTQNLKPSPKAEIPNLPPGSPLADLFKDFLGPRANDPRRVNSLGSGFIIDPSGYIVTNNHVIESDKITVTLNDGSVLPAKLVGRDEKTDLALLKVVPKKPLPAAKFGDSDTAKIGDWVMAIGNPFNIGSSVTAGIVSARNRTIDAGDYDDFIQTDAPINRGNSGGPLFDMDGNVIGINSAIYSPSGGSDGIGFAIPSNLARKVVGQLRQFGSTRRGWVGVQMQQVTPDLAEGLGLPSTAGALVAAVTPNGPANKGGVRNGDLITSVDGKPVADTRALSRIVAETAIGKTVNVDVLRNGRKQTFRVTVARLNEGPATPLAKAATPPQQAPKSKLAQLGLSLSVLDAQARSQFKLGTNVKGVVITEIAQGSPASERNLKPGDVIVQVQGQPVNTPDDVAKKIDADLKAGRKVETLLINSGGNVVYVALRLS